MLIKALATSIKASPQHQQTLDAIAAVIINEDAPKQVNYNHLERRSSRSS
ncbi:MAG: hypothetical protein EBE86_003915 [Hormoscilla sp. GUM202]|nr:hypothetical protein [Hormoscilla sp. GUM202]